MVNKDTVVNWEADEYFQQDKNTGWYVGLSVVGLLLVALSVWTKWWTFTALIVVSVISLVVYTIRPPRKLKYALSAKGLEEGGKIYNFADYKSFGVLQHDKRFAIVLTPKKRFSPSVTVFFPEEKGEEIVDMFGARLPMQEVKMDLLDKLVRWLRL